MDDSVEREVAGGGSNEKRLCRAESLSTAATRFRELQWDGTSSILQPRLGVKHAYRSGGRECKDLFILVLEYKSTLYYRP